MRVKTLSAAALIASFGFVAGAGAQISMPANSVALGLPVNGPTQQQTPGIVTLGQAAMATSPGREAAAVGQPASTGGAQTGTQPSAPAAASGPAVPASAAPTAASMTPDPAKSAAPTAQTMSLQQARQPSVAPLPTPLPSLASAVERPLPEITLLRISNKNGVQQATLYVRGITRSGLTVGSKVLKQVVSEFRDDGICLDKSLHKPKCATFITGNYE